MKFKLDENMPGALALLLSEATHDVATAQEEGLCGANDPPLLAAATAEGRVLLTFDQDFADVRRYPPASHAGIVVFRLKDQRWRTLEPAARSLLSSQDLATLGAGLTVVQAGRVRHRRGAKGRPTP